MIGDDWLKLQTLQQWRSKLFCQLGPSPGGTDETIEACRILTDIPSGEREQCIQDVWGMVTDEVIFILRQLERIEDNL